jgi:hypothetical protein
VQAKSLDVGYNRIYGVMAEDRARRELRERCKQIGRRVQ